MKKIYMLIAAVASTMAINAQTNLGFETWAATTSPIAAPSSPTGWNSILMAGISPNVLASPTMAAQGATCTVGGTAAVPVTQVQTNANEGTSYAHLVTHTVAGLPAPYTGLNGVHAGAVTQKFPYTQRTSGMTFSYKSNIAAGDSAAAYVELRKDGDVIGIGYVFIKGTNASWVSSTAAISYQSGVQPDTLEIIFASSARSIFGASLVGPAIDGSQLDIDGVGINAPLNEAAAITALTATDISDNGNGTDLRVSFTVPADESTISEYRVFVIREGYVAQNWAGLAPTVYTVLAKNGSDKIHTYNATSIFLDVVGNSLTPAAIENDIAMDVYVLSVADGTNATANRMNGPANITLRNIAGIADDLKLESTEVRVYPNPANNVVNFAFGASSSAAAIRVISLTGQLMDVVTVTETTSIDLDAYASGMYIYQVLGTNNEILKTNKFQVIK